MKYTTKTTITALRQEKQKLNRLAKKIKNIPVEFCDKEGNFNLDLVHLKLQDYQK